MDFADFGYVIVMGLWAALVVLLSYQLGYDNGRWAEITGENLKSESGKQKSETPD